MMKALEVVLKEMCKRVGADYASIDFQKERWYIQHSWTLDEQKDFIEWLTNYISKNKEAQKEMLNNPSKDKEQAFRAAKEFVFNYGWSIN